MVEIAFYIGKRKLYDYVCRLFMPSSHVEVVLDNICYSSSNRDGGVRSKIINLSSGRWEVYQIKSKYKQRVYSFFEQTQKAKYDYISAFVNHILRINKDYSNGRWQCVEWVIEALNCANELKLNKNMSMNEFYKYVTKKAVKDD